VELEITECAAVADLDATIDTVVALRGRGMHVALDRFGTGHSSLTWLQRIPVDGIKLDQSFTREMDERAADVVAAIVHLGRALRRLTIAQGVESAEQLRRIAELGCDGAQGYHIAPPMAASEFSSLSTVERC
jgi:EAL domain-containing protein (putative c-di-GMP-specific phosphodiesterase class I)